VPNLTTPAVKVESQNPSNLLVGVGSGLIEALNARNPAEQQGFLTANLSENALKEKSAADRAVLLQKASDQSGGVELVNTTVVSRDLVEFHVSSRRGEHRAKIYVFGDKRQPGKIREFGFVPEPSPGFLEQDKWPSTRLSESEVIEEMYRHVDLHDKNDVFSGAVLVAKDNKVIFEKAVGLAERSFSVPTRMDTKFHLGSMNKMFTSLSIAQLVEQGRLSFEDRISKVLPEYPNKENAEKIAIHHLLTHTAGLGSLFDRAGYDRREKYANSISYFKLFAKEPLIFEPGTNHSYSNEGFIVLGAVIEKLTGQNYHDYVRERIFRPSGMLDTDAYAMDEVIPNLAVGYARFEDDPFGIDRRRPNWMFLGWRGNACGGGYSTSLDLLKFSNALRHYKFVGKDLTEKLTSKQSSMPGYGMGFQLEERNGRKIVGHGGGGPNSGINSQLSMFWDGSYTVAVLGNYDAPAASNLTGGICEFLAYQ
jgi:D-alanyl-D-alanine carboxypeptidase